jgi:Fis family transcriptional regulator, factor for inversion stimulation protein
MFDSNTNRDQRPKFATIGNNAQPKPLRDSVKQALNSFLKQLDGHDPEQLYDVVLAELEAPLLEEVMTYTRGNQTRAATMLGINRGTLRKKLKRYGMN